MILFLFLAYAPIIFADDNSLDPQHPTHHQKTGHFPAPPPPQTSNAVFSRTQKETFQNPSPRICEDGSVALKGETCDDSSTGEDETDQRPSQDASD